MKISYEIVSRLAFELRTDVREGRGSGKEKTSDPANVTGQRIWHVQFINTRQGIFNFSNVLSLKSWVGPDWKYLAPCHLRCNSCSFCLIYREMNFYSFVSRQIRRDSKWLYLKAKDRMNGRLFGSHSRCTDCAELCTYATIYSSWRKRGSTGTSSILKKSVVQ